MTTENVNNADVKTAKKKSRTSTKAKGAKSTDFDPKMRNAPAKASRTVQNQVKEINETVKVIVPMLNVRIQPTKTSEVVRVLEEHDEVEIVAHVYGFGQLADETGYVHLDYVQSLTEHSCNCSCEGCTES